MKKLQEQDVIRIIREEWNAKISLLTEEIDLAIKAKGSKEKEESLVVAPGLKVLHAKSGIRYTVDSVSPRDVILLTPEGEQFYVNADEFEENYKID